MKSLPFHSALPEPAGLPWGAVGTHLHQCGLESALWVDSQPILAGCWIADGKELTMDTQREGDMEAAIEPEQPVSLAVC